jgi:hypothetical protein
VAGEYNGHNQLIGANSPRAHVGQVQGQVPFKAGPHEVLAKLSFWQLPFFHQDQWSTNHRATPSVILNFHHHSWDFHLVGGDIEVSLVLSFYGSLTATSLRRLDLFGSYGLNGLPFIMSTAALATGEQVYATVRFTYTPLFCLWLRFHVFHAASSRQPSSIFIVLPLHFLFVGLVRHDGSELRLATRRLSSLSSYVANSLTASPKRFLSPRCSCSRPLVTRFWHYQKTRCSGHIGLCFRRRHHPAPGE